MYSLAIHGGAGARPRAQYTAQQESDFTAGLTAALAAGERILQSGGSALDAVQASVVSLEDNALFNAAHGAVLAADGWAELDAAIMDGRDLRAGAIAAVHHIKNPIALARQILEHSPHVFLVADGAERFARDYNLELVARDYFVTPYRQRQLAALSNATAALATMDDPPLGTVGAVARDRQGNLAAATSTGGIAGKHPGRVGDSPVIGAGTYADNASCAVSTTGHGEWFLRTVQAYDIAARLRYGNATLGSAVEAALARLLHLGGQGGLIAVDQHGDIVMRYNSPAMFRAAVRGGQAPQIGID